MPVDVRASIALDYLSVDGVETVTLYQPGSTTGITVTYANRESVTTEWDGAGGAMVPGSMVRMMFWTEVCSERPKLQAKIVDANDVAYRVVTSALNVMETRYTCLCVREV